MELIETHAKELTAEVLLGDLRPILKDDNGFCKHYSFELTLALKRRARENNIKIIKRLKGLYYALLKYIIKMYAVDGYKIITSHVIEKTKKGVPHLHGFFTVPTSCFSFDRIKHEKWNHILNKYETTDEKIINIKVPYTGQKFTVGAFMCKLAHKIHERTDTLMQHSIAHCYHKKFERYKSPAVVIQFRETYDEIIRWTNYMSKTLIK